MSTVAVNAASDSVLRLTRRAALSALGAAGIGFVAFGPRPLAERYGSRLVLSYWEKWTGPEGEAMRRVVDEFNNAQSRIFVRYFSMGGIDQKAMIAIAGGDPPDIIGMGNFSVPAYADNNALIALDDLAASADIRREDYAAGVWPMLTHRGRLWAMVNTCGSLALFYNRAAFREVGLDPDRPPRTIDELDEYDQRLTAAESGDAEARLLRVGFLHTEPDWWSWHWGYFFGGSLYDEASDRALADSAPNIEAYEWVQRYPRHHGARRLVSFQSGFGFYGTAEHPFLTGKVAMTQQGPWLANVIKRFRPDLDYSVAPFPVKADLYDPSRPIGLLDSDVLVIPRGARHPEASFEFIAYTQRPEVVEYLSSVHCKNSPLARSSERFLAEHPNRAVAVHGAIAQSPRAFVFPRTRIWPQYVAEFDSGMQRLWRLEDEPRRTLASISSSIQKQLDHAAEQRRRRAAITAGAA